MIDWVTCLIPYIHPPMASGRVLFLDQDDCLVKDLPTRRSVKGSYDQTITIRSCGAAGEGRASHLSLSGNPSKFLQGHNVFGSDDLLALVYDTIKVIDQALALNIDRFSYAAIRKGHYSVSTVDINYSFELPCQTDVQTWIREAEIKSRSRCGRPSTRPGTIYWQKHSRRWALKAYSKFMELQANKDHRLPLQFQDTQLLPWTENILRIELRLKSLELADLKLTQASDLALQIPHLFQTYQSKIIMNTQLQLTDKSLHELPTKLLGPYTLWREGHNMLELFPRTSFYRYRKALLEHGVDISIACDRESSNVIPMVRVLEAKPARIPEWAFEQKLIHQSARAANF